MTDTGCFQSVDHLLHISHGCCQQGTHAQDVCLVFLDFFHKFVARYIYAYVDYLKAATFQHGSHQGFADEIGADGYSDNANTAVAVAKELMGLHQ